MPYRLNALHFYAHYNYISHMEKAVSNNSPLVRSRAGYSPLTLGIQRNLNQIVDILL